MKKYIAVLVLLFIVGTIAAQSRYKYKYVSVSFQPQYTVHSFTTNNVRVNDSLSSLQKNRGGFAISANFEKQLGRNLKLQTGITYTNTGFIREAKNLTFRTILHPDLDRIDQTIESLPEPSAEMNYVFDYIDLVALFNSKLKIGAKSKHWEFYGTYGASLNFLLADRVAVRLKGFTLNGERAFNLPNTYLSSKFFNITAHAGLRADYNHSNKLGFFTQPIINIPLLPVTSGDLSYRLASGGIQVGIFYNLDIKGEEEVIE